MNENPLLKLKALGQSVWLDYIQRALIERGEIQRMITRDGLAGMTSNPAIFAQAIAKHDDYDDAIAKLARGGASVLEIYEALTQDDVRRAADLLDPVYVASDGRDGYVSLEVSPHLADDTTGTITEAKRLWRALGRLNVMIKVPATRAGLPAIARLIADGVNVNVTLLFGLARYREVVEAFLAGLERRVEQRLELGRVASVASFFVSRIDTLVDRLLEEKEKPELRGETAAALARLAHQYYLQSVASPRWRALAERGAMSQRLLWASTSTKNPAYSDVKYVEALIGGDTVNTLTPETITAYRDHGEPRARLTEATDESRRVVAALEEIGIDLEETSARLEREGVEKFVEPYDRLLEVLRRKRAEIGETA